MAQPPSAEDKVNDVIAASLGNFPSLFASLAGRTHLDETQFSSWLEEQLVEPDYRRRYFHAVAEGTSTIDGRLFILALMSLKTDLSSFLPEDDFRLVFQMFAPAGRMEQDALIQVVSFLECLPPTANVLATLQSLLSQARCGPPPLSLEDFLRVSVSIARGWTGPLASLRELLQLHSGSRPTLTLNSETIAPLSTSLSTSSPEYTFRVPRARGPLSTMCLTIGRNLRKLAQDTGKNHLDVLIQMNGQADQHHKLSKSANYRLSWNLNPAFPLTADLVIKVYSIPPVETFASLATDMEGVTIHGDPVYNGPNAAGGASPTSNRPNSVSPLSPAAAGSARFPQPAVAPWKIASHALTVSRATGAFLSLDTLSSLHVQRAFSSSYSGNEFANVAAVERTISHGVDFGTPTQTILSLLDDFAKSGFNWSSPDTLKHHVKDLVNIANRVRAIASTEPRLVHVPPPAYVMGDLHGNFEDLKAFETAFWRQTPAMCPANLLFLGDYVDRRPFGLEVVFYLFAHKLHAPTKLTLLRGNHETRALNERDGFQRECISKLGEDAGMRVWEAVNAAFDCLPLAALIGGTVFCAHGGIPSRQDAGRDALQRIMRIPCPLRLETDCPLATDLMWSDPQDVDADEDYVDNEDRHLSHKFSTHALHAFMGANNIQYVIRAHQYKIHLGFQVQKKAKLITVFSSSAYCQMTNEASCILVSDGKVRMIRIDSIAQKM